MTPKMYYQLTVSVTPEISEWVSTFLFERGCLGIVEQGDQLSSYFDHPVSINVILDNLCTYLNDVHPQARENYHINISVKEIKDCDWNAEWKKSLSLIHVDESTVIKPTWVEYPRDNKVVIELDPEMAFGSGEHPTTRMTLTLIHQHITSENRFLDIGTGTGILAIAALMYGAREAFACDIDPVAAHTTQRNRVKNRVSPLYVYTGTLEAVRPDVKFDMIAANLNRSEIIKLLPAVSNRLNAGNRCFLSGILDTEHEMIVEACDRVGLCVSNVLSEQEWLAFETQKI